MKRLLACGAVAACAARLPSVTTPLAPLERDPYERPLGNGTHVYPGYPKRQDVRIPDVEEKLGPGAGMPSHRELRIRGWNELAVATHLEHVLSAAGPSHEIPSASELGISGELTITLAQENRTMPTPREELHCLRSIVEEVTLVVDGVTLRSREMKNLEPLDGSCNAPIRDYQPPQWFSLGITTTAPMCVLIEVTRGSATAWSGYACGVAVPHDLGVPRRPSGPIQRGDRVRLSWQQAEYCADPSCRERWRFTSWGHDAKSCPCTGAEPGGSLTPCTFEVGIAQQYACTATWQPVRDMIRAD